MFVWLPFWLPRFSFWRTFRLSTRFEFLAISEECALNSNPATFSPARKSIPLELPANLRERLIGAGRRELTEAQVARMVHALESYSTTVNIGSQLATSPEIREYLLALRNACRELEQRIGAGGKSLGCDAMADAMLGADQLEALHLLLAQLTLKCDAALRDLKPVDNRDFAGFTGFVVTVAMIFREAGGKITAQSNQAHTDTPFVALIQQLLDCFPEKPTRPESRVIVHRKNLGKALLDIIQKHRDNFS